MATADFISKIAPLVQKYAPRYDIKVCSPIIAQAILESKSGESDKVYVSGEYRHNYFGLKWRNGRCAVSNDYFEERTREQRADGTYIEQISKFCKFKSLEDCVIGYFQWTNISAYKNLKGVTDPRTYLENIKADGYATDLTYVEKVMAVVKKYNLTQYDINEKQEENGKMIINVHAGHNPDGMKACGAVGLIKESTEARKVKDKLIALLRAEGHTVYDCTVNDGYAHGVTSAQSDVLQKIVAKCNTHTVDLDVSIHFNSGANDRAGNKKTTGVEVLTYNNGTAKVASRVANQISALGFTNRGVKINTGLYFLKKTKSPAILVECCFVDDKDDTTLYNADLMATAIAQGILDKVIAAKEEPKASTSTGSFVVKCLDHLNIRKTPGGEIAVPNGCKKGTKYTITKVDGSWGYLKSGKGWINISSKYVTRV